MKILLFILSVALGMITMLLIIHASRLKTSKSKSTYFYLKIKKMSIDFEIADNKNKFDEYPLIKEEIFNVIKLIKRKQEFDVRKIRICRQKIKDTINNEHLDKVKAFKKEYDICLKKNKSLIEILDEANNIKNEIVRYRFPIRSIFDKYVFIAKLRILIFLVRIVLCVIKNTDRINSKRIKNKLNEYEDSEEIVEEYKNDNNNGFPYSGNLHMNT